MKGKKLIILVLLTAGNVIANAQEKVLVNDFETWSSLVVKKDFGKLDAYVDLQTRFNDNSSALDQYFVEVGAAYKIAKPLKLGFGYRYYEGKEKEGFVPGNRYHVDLESGKKLGRLKIEGRFRYQLRTEEDEEENFKKFRFKAGLRYNIKSWKLDPRLSAEYFRVLDGDNSYNQKMRYTLATKYKINKVNSVGAYYRIERDIEAVYPATIYILGLNYTLKL